MFGVVFVQFVLGPVTDLKWLQATFVTHSVVQAMYIFDPAEFVTFSEDL